VCLVHIMRVLVALAGLLILRATEAQDAKAGALLGICCYLGKGVKVGVDCKSSSIQMT